MRIQEIHIPGRVRKRKTGVDDLAESLAEFGLLQPVLVDGQKNLIAGYRRLQAAKALGWDTIEVRVIDVQGKRERLLLEIEENSVRQNFDNEEIYRARTLLRRYEKSGPVWRGWHWLIEWFERVFRHE